MDTLSPHPARPSETPEWTVLLRTAVLISTIAGLSAYLLARAGFAERSVVLAVIVVVSGLAWSGVLDRHPPAPLLRVRATDHGRNRSVPHG